MGLGCQGVVFTRVHDNSKMMFLYLEKAGVRGTESKRRVREAVRGHVEFTVPGIKVQTKFRLSLWGERLSQVRDVTCIS